MFKQKISFFKIIILISTFVFIVALVSLIFSRRLAEMFDVIGIRIATLFVAFAAFCSTTTFSFLVYNHNRLVSKINDDTNRRAEAFRELQFASSNYSIIEFMDRMLVHDESSRYIERYIQNKRMTFHMILEGLNEETIFANPSDYHFISIRIPFRVVEGKIVSKVSFEKLRIERENNNFLFVTPSSQDVSRTFILYNEQTKRNNVIMNLVIPKDSSFFNTNKITKLVINIGVTSLLGVIIKGTSEISFSLEQVEGKDIYAYKINSSNFHLSEMPKISNSFFDF